MTVTPEVPHGAAAAPDNGDLDARLDQAIAGWHDLDHPDARQDALHRLDELYWSVLDRFLIRAARRDREGGLGLSVEETLLVNFGLMDASMTPPDVIARLREESAGSGAAAKIHYFSDRLDETCRTLRLESASDKTPHAPSTAFFVSHLRDTRLKVLKRLAPYLQELPGIPREVAARMGAGVLDDDLLRLGMAILNHPERPLLVHRRRLKQLRENILDKARRRVRHPTDLQLFDLLQEIYARDWRERMAERQRRNDSEITAAPSSSRALSDSNDELLARLRDQVESLKAAARVAADFGGLHDLAPAFPGDARRVTRTDIARMTALAARIDREGEVPAPVVILPFAGRGAAAWEAGVLALALRPSVGTDDSVATALGHYRALTDAHQRGGELRKEYESRFPGAVFERDFVADYRVFLTKTASGDGQALSRERWMFFRDFVGPERQGPLIPANLRQIGPQTREAIARRMEKQLAQTPQDNGLRKRLAALHWLDGRKAPSVELFKEAIKLQPADAEAALSLGLALQTAGLPDAADSVFKHGLQHGKGTFWSLYCADALNNWT